MQEYNRVRLIVEKEKYARYGVHKGMDGWICDERSIQGSWPVCFDGYGDEPDIACIAAEEKGLEFMC